MAQFQIEYLSEQGVRTSEDTFLIDDANGLFAVFDGASSLTPYISPSGKTGALEAAEIAKASFKANPTDDLLKVADIANTAIQKRHEELGIDFSDTINRFSCTAAVVQQKGKSLNLLQNADSLILVKTTDGTVSLPLGFHDHDLSIMKKWRKLAAEGKKDIVSLVRDDLLTLRSNTNRTFGVLNGDPKAREFCKTTTVALTHIASLLIITDGLFLPKQDPETGNDWSKYFALCEDGGLVNLLGTVRSMEKSDPDLTRYPRYKIHDDATGIYLRK